MDCNYTDAEVINANNFIWTSSSMHSQIMKELWEGKICEHKRIGDRDRWANCWMEAVIVASKEIDNWSKTNE